ncbi:MAG: hypothetical protein HY877_02775 [Deltaproteobacteria bacterium]|nr:hypothetical protein [Deltaproteobacteria bacterium]
MAGDAKKEMTALEAIYAKNADCTERSKILYAVFLQAGLRPYFVSEDIKETLKKFRRLPLGKTFSGHVFLGVKLGSRFRYFDLALLNNNVQAKQPHILEPHQMAAAELMCKAKEQDKTGRRGEARRLITNALEMNPADGYVWYAFGKLMFDKPVFSSVVENAWRMAIKLLPEFWSPHQGLSLLLRRQGRIAEAEAEAKLAVQLDPNHR